MRIALIIVAAAVGAAAFAPAQASTTLPLADVKLVAEKAGTFPEGVAGRNGQSGQNGTNGTNGNHGSFSYGGYGGPRGYYVNGGFFFEIYGLGCREESARHAQELGDLDLGDMDLANDGPLDEPGSR